MWVVTVDHAPTLKVEEGRDVSIVPSDTVVVGPFRDEEKAEAFAERIQQGFGYAHLSARTQWLYSTNFTGYKEPLGEVLGELAESSLSEPTRDGGEHAR